MCFELQKLSFFLRESFFQCEDPIEISSDITIEFCQEIVVDVAETSPAASPRGQA